MLIVSFFTEQGAPKIGLSPTVDIVDIEADSLVVNGATMSALTTMTHCYTYNFTGYNELKKYAITVDGGGALNNLDRYQYADNIGGDVEMVRKKITNTGELDGSNNIFTDYDDDQVTALRTFIFKDINGNPTNRNVFKKERN
jgi:hypothetical protein